MIAEFFIGLAKNLILWGLGFFPTDWQIPPWVATASQWIASLMVQGANLGVWIPWVLLFTVAGATVVLWASGLLVKFARWLVGWIPTMGGS